MLFGTLPPDPGEAGKATLAGVDSDGDGVRDDVERIIASYGISNEKKNELKNYGKYLQKGIIGVEDEVLSIENSIEQIDQGYCMKSKMTEEEIDTYTSLIKVQQYNTKSRLLAWAKQQENFRGQFTVAENYESKFGEYCE